MEKINLSQKSLEIHQKHQGKMGIVSTVPLATKEDLSLAYTPGVGAVCQAIAENSSLAYQYTIKPHSVAVISDGTAVLGLGNIGPLGGLPVMEGKAVIFKQFAGLDAWPIVLNVHTTKEIVDVIKAISPGFGAINLEDIAAPQCFEIEDALQDLGIPVMHDDQHGTAIIVYAALLNAAKVLGKNFADLHVVVNGAGAAGVATSKMLLDTYQTGNTRVRELILCDSKGIIHSQRSDLNPHKQDILRSSNLHNLQGSLEEALKGADVFIGLSVAGALKPEYVKNMAKDSIIFALANPVPEIMPDLALEAGAAIIGTGRSDLPNQINNALVFPGVFKAALDTKSPRITPVMKYAAAKAISNSTQPTREQILPSIFDPELVNNIVKEITSAIS
jgi:malate dehydrogenase (oxaloacetate-decarboxylating)